MKLLRIIWDLLWGRCSHCRRRLKDHYGQDRLCELPEYPEAPVRLPPTPGIELRDYQGVMGFQTSERLRPLTTLEREEYEQLAALERERRWPVRTYKTGIVGCPGFKVDSHSSFGQCLNCGYNKASHHFKS